MSVNGSYHKHHHHNNIINNKTAHPSRLLLILILQLLLLQEDGLLTRISNVDACYWDCKLLNNHQMEIFSKSCAENSSFKYFIRISNKSHHTTQLEQCRTYVETPFESIRVACPKNYTQHDYLITQADLLYYKNNYQNSNESFIVQHTHTFSEAKLQNCLNHTIFNLTSAFTNNNNGKISVLLSWQTLKWDRETFAEKTVISLNGEDRQTLDADHTTFRIERMSRCKQSEVCVRLEGKHELKGSSVLAKKECITIATPCDPVVDNSSTLETYEIVLIVVGSIVFVVCAVILVYFKIKLSRKLSENDNSKSGGPVEETQLIEQTEFIQSRSSDTVNDSSSVHRNGRESLPIHRANEVYDRLPDN